MQRRSKTDRALLKLLGVQGGAWTTTDVAIATGMPLDVIEPRLLSLAVASGAQLRVADDGNVTYVFSAQLRRLLLARSWKLRLDACLRKVWSLLFWIIRCSFGVVLVVLVVLISLLVLLLGLALFWAEDDAANALLSLVGGGFELIVRIVVAVLTDQFWIGSPGRFPAADEQSPPQRVAFLESVYSILFGDGDPNQALETRRWQRIGGFLRHRDGVVIAEDLAPLLDLADPPFATHSSVTQSSEIALASEQADQGMLSVLLHFDGRPQVTEQGDLLYCFPSLHHRSVEASSAEDHALAEGASLPLRERRIAFTHANQSQRQAYGFLVVSLLGLSLLLLHWSLPLSAALVGIACFGLGYSLLLLALPLLRWFGWRRSNAAIHQRNRWRQQWADWAQLHRDALVSKRLEAARLRKNLPRISDGMVYTTENDLLTQPIDH
ncbi:hypothetical protein [Synechococcus sp. UW179B]|uniref:hypothetical protein n=1 Tax=Synechococcus sp. UW179B TaxID=2575516 RepID=UPI0010BD9439|nr:hypothetical protein [Synechococcus sp. UW179B]